MNKLCCCGDNELPDVSVNVNCACCKSRIEEHEAKDSTDFNITQEKAEAEDPTCSCCCFVWKHHAKSNRKKKSSRNGTEA